MKTNNDIGIEELHQETTPVNHTEIPEGFRRLKWNEVVSQGDFVADDAGALQLWEGPSGFQAESFNKAVYRQNNPQVEETPGVVIKD